MVAPIILLDGVVPFPDVVHLDMHVAVPRGTTIEAANRIAEAVHARVHRESGGACCTIHVEPETAPVPAGVA